MNKPTDEQKLKKLGEIINTFSMNEEIPAYLRWGLQVLFVAGSESEERSNVVAGLVSVGERAFNKAIERLKASGDIEGAKKLENDKSQMVKMALAIDFAGAIASVLKNKLSELSDDGDSDDASSLKNVIVGIAKPTKPEAVTAKNNPFAGRN